MVRVACGWVAAVAAGVVGLACGTDEAAGGGDGPAGPAAPLSYEPCVPEQHVGTFSVELAEAFTSVSGQVYDGVSPRDVPLRELEEGACRLLVAPNPQCSPVCEPTRQVCAEGNQCVPRPVARDMGTLTIRGLLQPMQIRPNEVTKSYSNPPTPRLPHPGFEPGADLRLTTSGGDYGPLELRGWGITLLEGVDNPVTVRAGQPTLVRWSAPEDPGPARVQLVLNINHHGTTNAWIECNVDDVGSAEVPVELIDALLGRGQSGFPTLSVTRRTASSAVIEPGCVEFLVMSQVLGDVVLDGLTSCSDASDCPAGQGCRPVELYCE